LQESSKGLGFDLVSLLFETALVLRQLSKFSLRLLCFTLQFCDLSLKMSYSLHLCFEHVTSHLHAMLQTSDHCLLLANFLSQSVQLLESSIILGVLESQLKFTHFVYQLLDLLVDLSLA
jgi:hypothetical protein